ncbi:MAG: hypothetical protein ACOCSK_02400 [Rhodothermales bacterium]
MTSEEFEKLKAQERAHLEKTRDLKQAVRHLEQQRSVVTALDRLQQSAQDLINTHADLVDQLARETAILEARIDLATEGTSSGDDAFASDEEALRKLRAQKVIEDIKQEVSEDSSKDRAPGKNPPDSEENSPKNVRVPRPDKTMGRM